MSENVIQIRGYGLASVYRLTKQSWKTLDRQLTRTRSSSTRIRTFPATGSTSKLRNRITKEGMGFCNRTSDSRILQDTDTFANVSNHYGGVCFAERHTTSTSQQTPNTNTQLLGLQARLHDCSIAEKKERSIYMVNFNLLGYLPTTAEIAKQQQHQRNSLLGTNERGSSCSCNHLF